MSAFHLKAVWAPATRTLDVKSAAAPKSIVDVALLLGDLPSRSIQLERPTYLDRWFHLWPEAIRGLQANVALRTTTARTSPAQTNFKCRQWRAAP